MKYKIIGAYEKDEITPKENAQHRVGKIIENCIAVPGYSAYFYYGNRTVTVTSVVDYVKEENNLMKIYTMNTIYVLQQLEVENEKI